MTQTVLDLNNRLLDRAISSLLDVNVSKSDDDILIRLKATNGFAPTVFHELPVTLILGHGHEVPGLLHVCPSDVPRGMWFTYCFQALRSDDYCSLLFKRSRNPIQRRLRRYYQPSNIEVIRLDTDLPHMLENPLFKK